MNWIPSQRDRNQFVTLSLGQESRSISWRRRRTLGPNQQKAVAVGLTTCHDNFDRKKPHPPGGCSIYYVPTVASRREISYTRLLIREHSKQKTPPGGGGSFDQSVKSHGPSPGAHCYGLLLVWPKCSPTAEDPAQLCYQDTITEKRTEIGLLVGGLSLHARLMVRGHARKCIPIQNFFFCV